MPELLPFDRDTPCPACGIQLEIERLCREAHPVSGEAPTQPWPEHLHLRCPGCAWAGVMATAGNTAARADHSGGGGPTPGPAPGRAAPRPQAEPRGRGPLAMDRRPPPNQTPGSFPAPLTDGYRRFRANRFAAERERYRRLADEGQRPSAMVIACSDSRSAPETIFDAGPGELFVVRNVAALVPACAPDGRHHATSAALEFAVLGLGVRAIVVLGHARCGGIAAVIGQTAPLSRSDFIGSWMSDVRDLAAAARDNEPIGSDASARQTELERAVVARSLAHLRTFPWISDREAAGDLVLHGAWFDIGPGALYVLDPAGRWHPLSVA